MVDRVIEEGYAAPSARTLQRIVDDIEDVLPALGVSPPRRAGLRAAQGAD
jgi:hypothetical protein